MNYENFKNLKATEKWFYVWTALENHLSQIKEVKWILRAILVAVIGWWVKGLFFG